MPMSFRRVAGLAAVALTIGMWAACGQVYRPVVIPVNNTPPNPANFHAVFGISTNAPGNSGTALQIDVSGDTEIGAANMGINPTHAVVLPNNSRVFVTAAGTLNNDGSVNLSGADVVTTFTPAANSIIATGLTAVNAYTFPNVGPTGSNGKPAWFCSYLPDFVTTTQTSAAFVANYGVENDPNCAPNPNLPNGNSTDSVFLLSPVFNTITNIAYLAPGSHPVALVETPNGLNLYVLNQGTNTVMNLSTTDLSTVTTIPVGTSPAWAVARADGQRIYVVTQGDGNLYTIGTDTNAILSTQSVGGPGANYVLYDKNLNRLYVVNPAAGAVYAFSATTDPPSPMGSPTGALSVPPPAPCAAPGTCSAVAPVSIAALPDGSRFYVASYVTENSCTDPNVGANACMIPMLTVFDAPTLTIKAALSSALAPSLSLLTVPQFASAQYAVPVMASCAPTASYTPNSTRFRMSAAPAADSSHVYVSICDAGAIADVTATTSSVATGGTNGIDQLVNDLLPPFSAGPPNPNTGEPPPQSPIFLLTGQ